jgi:hypothetical protein
VPGFENLVMPTPITKVRFPFLLTLDPLQFRKSVGRKIQNSRSVCYARATRQGV